MIQDLAQQIIRQAIEHGSSDLYLIPKGDTYQLFNRQHNQRKFLADYPAQEATALISHFKFLAGMNLGEHRRSQQGACHYDCGKQTISLRLSTVGDYKGRESIVIRLLHDQAKSLAFWSDGLTQVENAIKGRGLYLFSGPVGSGKTTLMYHLAQQLFADQQILTIEDPVEIKQDNMLQLQLNEAIGSTYDDLIKLSLRHRPDLLIIGEIRDQETARAVIRASLTGATVFSTVHAKSIPGVYARMLELGVSPEELHHALQGITYQRLIQGRGIIDHAHENFESHSPDQWNQQIDDLLAAGHIHPRQAETEKIAANQPA